MSLSQPPLGLYVHLPWCVRKCPYCDFNSHTAPEALPSTDYIQSLLADLEADLPLIWGRTIAHVYMGGGTPSLFSAEQVDQLLAGIRARVNLAPAAEISLEANPGTIERDSFSAYFQAGVNRVSLGAQSFDDACLKRLGRIHGHADIETSIASLGRAGMNNFNVDLMYGLPGQNTEAALEDVRKAIGTGATHISHYQLTIEPNTAFAANPPQMPVDDDCWAIMEASETCLREAGYEQYEISAWCRDDQKCQHNYNYWKYGDFLGIGAGAHSKITDMGEGCVRRIAKSRHPARYMGGERLAESRTINASDLLFEYFLNRLRLREVIPAKEFEARTGLNWQFALSRAAPALEKQLMKEVDGGLELTAMGWRFVNDVQAQFLPEN